LQEALLKWMKENIKWLRRVKYQLFSKQYVFTELFLSLTHFSMNNFNFYTRKDLISLLPFFHSKKQVSQLIWNEKRSLTTREENIKWMKFSTFFLHKQLNSLTSFLIFSNRCFVVKTKNHHYWQHLSGNKEKKSIR
jgi:hypothetical protein